jgi:hypothetical protein
MGIAGESFDELVRPELKEEFEKDKNNWFPRTDTKENRAFDKRKPGLFKVEFEGDGIIALCSKSYFCWSDKKSKFSSKGVNKRTNNITKKQYLDCLVTGESSMVTNKGFRMKDGHMFSYTQKKKGFSSFYAKRKVLADGRTTTHTHL